MRIAALLAVSALLAISAIPARAQAADTRTPPTTCNSDHVCGGPGDGGGVACAAICGLPEAVTNANYRDCSESLTHLPRITKGDIAMIGPGQRLHIAPVCQGYADLSLTEKQHSYFDRGNTPGLETAIAANLLVMAELTSHHYKVDDLIGILIGSNAAVLYVHKM